MNCDIISKSILTLGELMIFTPVVRNSNSIAKSLLEFSKDRNIPTKLLDFELISYETLIKREHDTEYKVIQKESEISREDLLNDETHIIQEYSIKIIPLSPSSSPIKLLLSANKQKTKAVVTIQKGSVFNQDAHLLRELKQMIWHKKLRAGLFIDMFETNLEPQLKKLLKLLPYGKPLYKDIKFVVAQGIESQPPMHAKIEKIYEQKEQEVHSIIEGVTKGDLVIKYIKAKEGSDGRACNGKFLYALAPSTKVSEPKIDESIVKKELPDFIEYYANENGYVLYYKGNLSISKTLNLEGADFKSTGDIEAGEASKDISVNIAHKKSQSEDAIGSGVNIDVKTLNVDGAVGSNVTISTDDLVVDAQTHKRSQMEVANSANIKLHRGDLIANDAEIDILETGKVTAHRTIYIKKMVGGEAIAPVVKVDQLFSNSTIIASELIEIKSIHGEDNKLIINPDVINSYHKDIATLKEKIKETHKKLKVESELFTSKAHEHSEQIDRIKTFQKRIILATKSGKTPMKQDVIRVRTYKRESEKLTLTKELLAKEQAQIKLLEEELEAMYSKDLQAKIIMHTSYDGNTKVIFINPKTADELMKLPKGTIETISLELNEENEREIKFH